MRKYAILLALAVWLLYPATTKADEIKTAPYMVFEVVDGPQYIPPQPKPSTPVRPRTKFSGGWCTDYVARKAPVTWRGNANRWIANAKAQGYQVDKIPKEGDILVTNESRRYGHVTYIEKVEGNLVTISEWNYAGRYKLTYRTIDISSRIVMGVIHITNG